jgi:hypothetical protein
MRLGEREPGTRPDNGSGGACIGPAAAEAASGPVHLPVPSISGSPRGGAEGCAPITGAHGASLKLSIADVGGTLEVIVKATSVTGSDSATTPVTGLIGP